MYKKNGRKKKTSCWSLAISSKEIHPSSYWNVNIQRERGEGERGVIAYYTHMGSALETGLCLCCQCCLIRVLQCHLVVAPPTPCKLIPSAAGFTEQTILQTHTRVALFILDVAHNSLHIDTYRQNEIQPTPQPFSHNTCMHT